MIHGPDVVHSGGRPEGKDIGSAVGGVGSCHLRALLSRSIALLTFCPVFPSIPSKKWVLIQDQGEGSVLGQEREARWPAGPLRRHGDGEWLWAAADSLRRGLPGGSFSRLLRRPPHCLSPFPSDPPCRPPSPREAQSPVSGPARFRWAPTGVGCTSRLGEEEP